MPRLLYILLLLPSLCFAKGIGVPAIAVRDSAVSTADTVLIYPDSIVFRNAGATYTYIRQDTVRSGTIDATNDIRTDGTLRVTQVSSIKTAFIEPGYNVNKRLVMHDIGDSTLYEIPFGATILDTTRRADSLRTGSVYLPGSSFLRSDANDTSTAYYRFKPTSATQPYGLLDIDGGNFTPSASYTDWIRIYNIGSGFNGLRNNGIGLYPASDSTSGIYVDCGYGARGITIEENNYSTDKGIGLLIIQNYSSAPGGRGRPMVGYMQGSPVPAFLTVTGDGSYTDSLMLYRWGVLADSFRARSGFYGHLYGTSDSSKNLYLAGSTKYLPADSFAMASRPDTLLGPITITNNLTVDTLIANKEARADSMKALKGLFVMGGDTMKVVHSGDSTHVSTTAWIFNFLKAIVSDSVKARLDIITPAIKHPSHTPTTLSGDVNDWDVGNKTFVRASGGAGDRIVTGIVARADGHVMYICNVGTTNKITFANESASSTAANRILTYTAGSIEIGPNCTAEFIYDATSARWREVSHL
jgi:hypothetical protein